MRLIRIMLVVLVSFAGFVACSHPDPREKLETAIPEAIRLLEAKQYESFLRIFATPNYLEKFEREHKPDEKLANQISEKQAALLLQVLHAVEGKQPTYNIEKTQATFFHGVEGAAHDTIVFLKIGNFWYIKN